MFKLKFKAGDKVFAKVKGYCPWPAKVEGIANATKNRIKYHVFFYGTQQLAVCNEENIFLYNSAHIAKYGKPKKLKYFNDSMKEIEDDTENVASESIDVNNAESSKLSEGVGPTTYSLNSQEEVVPDSSKNLNKPYVYPDETTKSVWQSIIANYESNHLNRLLNSLETEEKLLEILFKVQSALSIDRADVELSLMYLDELIALNLNPLMVKKHPEVVYTLILLEEYRGNVSEWNLPRNDELFFLSQTEIVRTKATLAFDKIKSLFEVPSCTTFKTFFDVEMEEFKKNTEALPRDVYLTLI